MNTERHSLFEKGASVNPVYLSDIFSPGASVSIKSLLSSRK
jgi:hypothetical protein